MTDDQWQAYAKQQRRMVAMIIVAAVLTIPLVIVLIGIDWLRGIYGRIKRQ